MKPAICFNLPFGAGDHKSGTAQISTAEPTRVFTNLVRVNTRLSLYILREAHHLHEMLFLNTAQAQQDVASNVAPHIF